MENKSIIHLEFKGRHEYFSAPSALYAKYTANDLLISQGALNNYFSKHKEDCPIEYRNTVCIIRKGVLERKKKEVE